jgi:hypothetical protein
MRITNCEPRGRVAEICRWLLTAEGRFQSQDNGHGDRSETVALWRVFLRVFRFSPVSSIPTTVPQTLAYDREWKMVSLEATCPETQTSTTIIKRQI